MTKICNNCGAVLDRSSSRWQQHPFNISYHWDIEMEAQKNDDWWHLCNSDKMPREYGFGVKKNDPE